MLPRHLTVGEHETISIDSAGGNSLTPAEADYLCVVGEDRPGFCERGYRSIRFAQFCGLISLENRLLEILPKVDERASPDECRGILLRLLREAGSFPLFRHLPAGQHVRRATLLEVFIGAFLDAVTKLVRGGLLRRYREHEEDLQVVRGRIVLERQFAANANRPDLISCRFDEFTENNEWNRAIKTGLMTVRPWIRSTDLSRQWFELAMVFEGVDDRRATLSSLSRLNFDRHAGRYKEAIDWVRLILSLLSPDLRAGTNSAPTLLIDMNRLFEAAVASTIHRQMRYQPAQHLTTQDRSRTLARIAGSNRAAFPLRPDLVIRNGDSVAAIADTKWKRVDVGPSGHLIPSESDVYQMLAYAAGYSCDRLVLIYPWHHELVNARSTSYEVPSFGARQTHLDVICVDVGRDGLPQRELGREHAVPCWYA